MPYNSNERLEREARESLVASDLSAKMKQWRNQTPPPKGGRNGNSVLLTLLVLLALGGAAWYFWPTAEQKAPQQQELPTPLPTQTPTQELSKPIQEPIAQNAAPPSNRYLALAQSHYQAPDFAAEIRGKTQTGQDMLNDARRALAARQFTEALNALQNTPTEYKTDAAYLRAHALFGLKKYAQSAALFGQLTGSIRYGEAAQWYEVLSLLPDAAQNKSLILKKLTKMAEDEGHTYQSEAGVLLKEFHLPFSTNPAQ